ncbi:MAG: hypothetical protein JWQ98_2654 [Chlorobi bacterium]|nr:hypothetical protein [Chlorobiota bacterium]
MSGAYAQGSTPDPSASRYFDRRSTADLTIGAGYALGGSTFLDPAENWKITPVTSYKFGVDITYPLAPIASAALSLGLDSRGGKSTWYQTSEIWDTRRVSYFSINPGIILSGFYIGINFGVPLGGTRTWHNGAEDRTYAQDIDAGYNKLLTMVEPRIGAVLPLTDQDIGWLGLTLMAGYNLNDISENRSFLPGEDPKKTYSTQTVAAQIGLTWQFSIPGTSRK